MAVVSWLSNDNEVTKNKIRDDNIAPIESNALSASKTYTVGKPFVLDSDGKLYKATQQIDQGSAIITSGENANCEEVSNGAEGIFGTKQDIFNLNSAVGNLASRVGIAEGNITTLNEIKANTSDLGTASTKNAISVVTDSSDLVESGAVKDIVGWGNKNLIALNLSPLAPQANVNTSIVSQNADKVVLTSESTAYANFKLFYPFKKGTYTISLKASSSDSFTPIVVVYKYGTQNEIANNVSQNNPVTFTLSEDTDIEIKFFVTTGTAAVRTVEFYDVQIEKGSTATSYEPYHASVEETLRDAEVVEGKNLLPNNLVSGMSSNGVTHTKNADGSISLSGIAMAGSDAGLDIYDTSVSGKILEGLTLVLSKGDTTVGVSVSVNAYNNATFVKNLAVASGSNSESIPFTVDYSNYNRIKIVTYILGGTNTNNKTLYPMIRKATETDPTYEPYYIPLKDVVPTKADNSVIGTVEDGATASQAYAVGEHFIKDGAFKEVTQPIASGGDINDSNTVDKPIADCLVYKAGDSIEVGDGTYPTMYNGIFFSNNTALRFVIRVDKKIIANNVAISNSGIGICNADGIVASVLNLTANYNIIILNIKNTDIQVQMSKKDGTAFSVTDGSTAVVRFYGTLTFS